MRSSSQKNIIMVLLLIMASALAARLCVAVAFINWFDTSWFRKWAVDLPNGFFNVYSRAEKIELDYPPIYLFFLYPIGLIYKVIGIGSYASVQMFLLKSWAVLFDVLCLPMFYLLLNKYSTRAAWMAVIFWALNPSVFFNSALWGQIDSVMIFLLLAVFLLAEKERYIAACILMAVAGMTKFQCLYFVPVLLAVIYKRSDLKKLIKGILSAAATVIIVFLPFSIGAKNPLLFFDLYLSSSSKYPYCTLNAFNVYGVFKLNWVKESIAPFGIQLSVISTILTILIVAGVIMLILKSERPCIFLGSALIMESLFILTIRMHERYQIVVLPFLLIAALKYKSKHFAWQFASLTVITFINQALCLFKVNNAQAHIWEYYDTMMSAVSVVNVVVFVWFLITAIRFFLKRENTSGKDENSQTA